MKTLSYLNFILAALFTACYCYQIVFFFVRLLKKRRCFQARKLCRYAVLIAARNESAVIGQLLDSIREQDYPQELLDVYVVADNCTDDTAQIAASRGAAVYERENRIQVGKGYALHFLLRKIREDRGEGRYDGYFVFDADNLLASNYVTEMNKAFSSGCRVVTSYRNTKNFGDNWITAGYGIWFLRESEYLNRPRDFLGASCAVSGTGFLFSDKLLEETGGWEYFLLTEDLEFTAAMVARGEKIAYCGTAMIYDEQPRKFGQSIAQRSRWVKGYLQVVAKRGGDLIKGIIKEGSFSCYDMLMNTIPAVVLTILGIVLNTVMFVVGITGAQHEMGIFFASVLLAALNSYTLMYFLGLVALLTEWDKIRCPAGKKIRYSFTFPLFVFSFGFAMAAAVFGNIEWKPIKHTAALSIGDLGSDSRE